VWFFTVPVKADVTFYDLSRYTESVATCRSLLQLAAIAKYAAPGFLREAVAPCLAIRTSTKYWAF
jgi:hypothetical protein